MSETISRDAAINELERAKVRVSNSVERAIGRGIIEILDDVEKSIIGLPPAKLATDTNVGTKLGTNLAEVGTDCISRQAAIEVIDSFNVFESRCDQIKLEQMIGELPPASNSEIPNSSDTISRQAAIKATWQDTGYTDPFNVMTAIRDRIQQLPSAQPEQRYTEEELRVFQHGISLSLLSKRSSQHWQYDEDTATEIKFLERLYEKVVADIRSEHDE